MIWYSSHLYFQDEASSLDLNRRMRILKTQRLQQQLREPEEQRKKTKPALLPSGGETSSPKTLTSSLSGNMAETNSSNSAGVKRSPPIEDSSRGTEMKEIHSSSDNKRVKIADTVVNGQPLIDNQFARGAAESVLPSQGMSAGTPSPQVEATTESLDSSTTDSLHPPTVGETPAPAGPDPTTRTLPPKFKMSQPHRQVQKFRFVQHQNKPLIVQNSLGGRQRGGEVVVAEDPGYRDLLATFANVWAASNDDLVMAEKIQQACDQGGEFVASSGNNNVEYYYQYEVLSTTLSAQHTSHRPHERGIRTSLGLHTFLQNTMLPQWFPLSNLQLSNKVLTQLSMKRDHSGKLVYDNSKDVQLLRTTTPTTGLLATPTPATVTSSAGLHGAVKLPDVTASLAGGAIATLDLLVSAGTHLPMHPRTKPKFQIGVIGGGIYVIRVHQVSC